MDFYEHCNKPSDFIKNGVNVWSRAPSHGISCFFICFKRVRISPLKSWNVENGKAAVDGALG
jgi:hypothetical protein